MNDKIKEIIEFVIVIGVVLLIKQFIITPIRVNQSSMNDTLHDKDIMILDKISYRFQKIKRFDIVVIKKEDEYLIKRVIGLPGEIIKYEDNKLYVDGKLIEENFLHKNTKDYELTQPIPSDYYFVIGDNRPNSLDSRVFGFVSRDEIIGKTNLVIYPFSHFGVKK
ncbi:MAG: signal peptidase I [Bacilli bacterium]|nr:signal peptidase I [Bacilli bacterium]